MSTLDIKVIQIKQTNSLSYRSYLRIVNVPFDEVDTTKGIHHLLELVFKYGQNDFQPKNSPSVSVGDIAVVNDKYYLCEPFDWTEIEPV